MGKWPVFAMVDKWDGQRATGDDGAARRAAELVAKEDAAREQHERYLANAPTPTLLDELERRIQRGDARAPRQIAPGVYRYVGIEHDTGAVYVGQIGGGE